MSVKTALRVVDILEAFATERQALSLSELARVLEMPVSSCLGLIRTLESRGYLYEAGRRQGYYPTSRWLAMAQAISAHDPVLDRVKPGLQALRDATGETAVFSKLRADGQVVYLEVCESRSSIRYSAQAGELRDAYANSAGRALLSMLDDRARTQLLASQKMVQHTPHTRATAVAVADEVAAGLQRGWFANLGESLPDLAGLAWPLKLAGEGYAISIAGPLARLQPRMAELATLLRATCAEIEQQA